MNPAHTWRLDSSFAVNELAIFRAGVDPRVGWLPCREPERPLDDAAAVRHVLAGEPCRGCAVAWDAHVRRGGASPTSP